MNYPIPPMPEALSPRQRKQYLRDIYLYLKYRNGTTVAGLAEIIDVSQARALALVGVGCQAAPTERHIERAENYLRSNHGI